MSDFTQDQIRVAKNILTIARKYFDLTGVPPLAHLAVTKQESGWDDSATGDVAIGGSHGPYQIYVVAHPTITPAVATDPWYDYAFAEMRNPWRDAWAQFGSTWILTDRDGRAAILQSFAPAAQGSIGWSLQLAQARYDDAIQMLEIIS